MCCCEICYFSENAHFVTGHLAKGDMSRNLFSSPKPKAVTASTQSLISRSSSPRRENEGNKQRMNQLQK